MNSIIDPDYLLCEFTMSTTLLLWFEQQQDQWPKWNPFIKFDYAVLDQKNDEE